MRSGRAWSVSGRIGNSAEKKAPSKIALEGVQENQGAGCGWRAAVLVALAEGWWRPGGRRMDQLLLLQERLT